MAVLSAASRKALPTSTFAGPGRSFPIPDKNHAKAALSLVGRSLKKGNVTAMQAAGIRRRAKMKLGMPKQSLTGVPQTPVENLNG